MSASSKFPTEFLLRMMFEKASMEAEIGNYEGAASLMRTVLVRYPEESEAMVRLQKYNERLGVSGQDTQQPKSLHIVIEMLKPRLLPAVTKFISEDAFSTFVPVHFEAGPGRAHALIQLDAESLEQIINLIEDLMKNGEDFSLIHKGKKLEFDNLTKAKEVLGSLLQNDF